MVQQSNILLLYENWLNNMEEMNIPNYDFIVHFNFLTLKELHYITVQTLYDGINIGTPYINLQQTNSLSAWAIGKIWRMIYASGLSVPWRMGNSYDSSYEYLPKTESCRNNFHPSRFTGIYVKGEALHESKITKS